MSYNFSVQYGSEHFAVHWFNPVWHGGRYFYLYEVLLASVLALVPSES